MRVLITGASKGIGRALAEEFAKHNFDLILCARSHDIMKEHASELRKLYGVEVDSIAIDLAKEGAVQSLINQLNENALSIDVLVNNVGLGYHGAFTEMEENRMHTMMQLNMNVLTQLTHHFAKQFKDKKQGYILQVASLAGFMPGPQMALYYATKSFVLNLSLSLADELKNFGVYLSVLCPGPTQTGFFEQSKMEGTYLSKGLMGMQSAEYVANYAYKNLMKGKVLIIPGIKNKVLAYSTRFAPTAMLNWITNKLLQSYQQSHEK